MKKQEASENQQLLNNILQHWLTFKRFVLKAFSQEPVTPEDEQEFLEAKSHINKITRMLSERIKALGFEGDKIGGILRTCISVSQLRGMPVPDRRGLYKEWHSIYVSLNQAQGAVDFIGEGWEPRTAPAKAGTSIADIKGGVAGAKTKKKGKKGMLITGFTVLAIIGAIVYFVMNQ